MAGYRVLNVFRHAPEFEQCTTHLGVIEAEEFTFLSDECVLVVTRGQQGFSQGVRRALVEHQAAEVMQQARHEQAFRMACLAAAGKVVGNQRAEHAVAPKGRHVHGFVGESGEGLGRGERQSEMIEGPRADGGDGTAERFDRIVEAVHRRIGHMQHACAEAGILHDDGSQAFGRAARCVDGMAQLDHEIGRRDKGGTLYQ